MINESKEAAVFVDIKELKPWEKNPRINTAAVQKVETSIRRFGFAAPIVARKEDHMIIAGHTRWKAVHNITEYMTGQKKVPVRFMDITREEAEKLALADNKLNEIAEWDDDLLKHILSDMDTETALDLGWNTEELTKLLDIEIEEEVDYTEEDLDYKYQILIEDLTEQTQADLFQKLESEGYKCRPLTI